MPKSIFKARLPVCCLLALASFLPVSCASAQITETGQKPWTFLTRIVISGNSDQSDPAGYKAYSGIALEAGIARDWGHHLVTELSIRTESREVDHEATSGLANRLGSLELLPLTAILQYRPPFSDRIHPYLGLGANLTVVWEKSGVLDSLDIGPHLGPALQLGMDYNFGKTAVLNLNIGWNTLTSDIKISGRRFAKLKIDPIALSMGVGFHF